MIHQSTIVAFSNEKKIPAQWSQYTQAMLALPGTHRAVAGEWSTTLEPGVIEPERISITTLVVHGTADNLVPYPVGEDLHRRLPNSAMESVIGGSHMLPVTHSQLLAERIDQLVGTRYRDGTLPEPTGGQSGVETTSPGADSGT